MTDQKRDESTKRYQPIQQDPARRIRRIQRWLGKCGEAMPSSEWLWPYVANDKRWATADKLFAAELDWLCRYAADVWKALHREESNKAAIALDLERETEVLSDIKEWSSEEINELRSKLSRFTNCDGSALIRDMRDAAHSSDVSNHVASLLFSAIGVIVENNQGIENQRATIAEQKARIEELEFKLSRIPRRFTNETD